MHSKLKPGIKQAAIDSKIVEFVDSYELNEFPMMEKYIAVKNEAGELYRVIVADGVIEAIEADKFLVGLGCIEEHTQNYNAMFRAPPIN